MKRFIAYTVLLASALALQPAQALNNKKKRLSLAQKAQFQERMLKKYGTNWKTILRQRRQKRHERMVQKYGDNWQQVVIQKKEKRRAKLRAKYGPNWQRVLQEKKRNRKKGTHKRSVKRQKRKMSQ